ncbi:hypothetical protein PsYK624_130860 [Phanerochaete sordida]|uniref:Uncharacterized protein n=1 Tax=Phanerochaete sordida TaxID=48140 RepID=A0A9P3GL17_9APHY|nr:hypothetical protein PsYK624_130860 [Phanerochaete sordida]
MQVVFWLDDTDSDGRNPITTNLVTDWGSRAVVSQPHLGLAVRWQFWIHVELFPAHRSFPGVALEELKRAFNLGLCDSIATFNSTFFFESDSSTRLAQCLDRIIVDDTGEMPGSAFKSMVGNGEGAFVTARLLAILYHDRFLNFWGERGARLIPTESALDFATPARSWIFKLVSPLCFFMPFVYMQEFDQLYVDRTVNYRQWRIFIEGLKKDWENSITPATLLIATNIGFLSIGSIDGNGTTKNSTAQIMSYISTILAAFIYICCQILQQPHRHHLHVRAIDALGYINRRADRLLGLESMAIAFSIPTALFLWSMITFLAAMMVVFFDKAPLGTRITLGVLLGLMLLVLVLLLYLDSDSSFPGAFNILGLAKEICSKVAPGWKALSLHFNKSNASAEDQQRNNTTDVPRFPTDQAV